MRVWGLTRPTGLTASILAEVLGEAGYGQVARKTRPAVKATTDIGQCVEFVRRWLCLDASRDKEAEPQWQVSGCRR